MANLSKDKFNDYYQSDFWLVLNFDVSAILNSCMLCNNFFHQKYNLTKRQVQTVNERRIKSSV